MLNTSLVLFGIFIILLICNIPIAVSLGIASIVSIVVTGLPIEMFPINVFSASSKFSLLAIPFFIVAGNIMEKAGISEKLIDFAKACVGHRKNGVALVCVIVSCFFAAISGSGPATVAALGVILIPSMVKEGYPVTFASALMAAGGAIGVIIPPSVTFIVYGASSGASIAKIFMAGVIPGLLMGAALVFATIFCARKFELKQMPKASGKERWRAFKDAVWGLMMPVIILGGIYSGIFTPTEAAAVSAVYGLIIGIFVYKKIRLADMAEMIVNSGSQTDRSRHVRDHSGLLIRVGYIGGRHSYGHRKLADERYQWKPVGIPFDHQYHPTGCRMRDGCHIRALYLYSDSSAGCHGYGI